MKPTEESDKEALLEKGRVIFTGYTLTITLENRWHEDFLSYNVCMMLMKNVVGSILASPAICEKKMGLLDGYAVLQDSPWFSAMTTLPEPIWPVARLGGSMPSMKNMPL